MNPQDILRTQLMMSMGGVGSTGWAPLRNLVLLNVWDRAIAQFPSWSQTLQQVCCRRRKTQSNVPSVLREVRAQVDFIKNSDTSKSAKNHNTSIFSNRMDAVIYTISKNPAIRNLLSLTQSDYLPHDFDPIAVDNDLYFQLEKLEQDDGIPSSLKFRLFCQDHDVVSLQEYIESCMKTQERHMNNKLGSNLQQFDMKVDVKDRASMSNPLPKTHLMFSKHIFQTNRNFENVFFEQRQAVKNHTEFFLTRKDWQDAKGIPHTLGFLFHGEPGCGKTSTIKAIANVGRRHIINIHLAEIKSKEQLRDLFFNDTIRVVDNGKSETFTIPVHERIYVIEDIDAMGDAVLRREWKKPEPVKKEVTVDRFGNLMEEEEKNPIDLSFLLNLLDGTLETSGRILAITSNFPERIDRALIRPGRIDMIVHFEKCSNAILQEMVENFQDQNFDDFDWKDPSLHHKWSPAEVNQVLFRNFSKPIQALQELKDLNQKSLQGFQIDDPSE